MHSLNPIISNRCANRPRSGIRPRRHVRRRRTKPSKISWRQWVNGISANARSSARARSSCATSTRALISTHQHSSALISDHQLLSRQLSWERFRVRTITGALSEGQGAWVSLERSQHSSMQRTIVLGVAECERYLYTNISTANVIPPATFRSKVKTQHRRSKTA